MTACTATDGTTIVDKKPFTAAILLPGTNPVVHAGDTVNIHGKVDNAANPTNLIFNWDFGDGQTSDVKDPAEHIYTNPGDFVIKFSVTDSIAKTTAKATDQTLTVLAFDTDSSGTGSSGTGSSGTGSAGTGSAGSGSGSGTPTGDKIISFVVLNDLHAHLLPHDDFQRNNNGTSTVVKRGGLARIATMMQLINSDNPNNVVMNIGDTFHGGVEAFYSLGNDIVDVVNQLPIDVGVPGNWDFAYGPMITRMRFTESNFPLQMIPNLGVSRVASTQYPDLAANLTFSLNPCSRFPRLRNCQAADIPGTWRKTIDGIEVGFIGITSDIVEKMHTLLATGMTFTQGEDHYIALINAQAKALREPTDGTTPADIVVVMSELGIHKDNRLAKFINPHSVDIFFSAHTHELVTTPLESDSGAIVVEAGNDTYLGRMDVYWDSTQGKIGGTVWQVLPVELTIAEDPIIKQAIVDLRGKYLTADPNLSDPSIYPSGQTLRQSITTPLATTDRIIARHHSLENSFNNLLTDLLRKQYKTQIAITPGFRFDTAVAYKDFVYENEDIATGEILVEDVYRFIPVAYSVATATITGKQLKQVIETNLSEVYSPTIFNQAGGWADGFSGLTMVLDLAQPDPPAGTRILSLMLTDTGLPIDDNLTYSIAGCVRPAETLNSSPTDITAGKLCSYSGFTSVVDTGTTMIQAFTDILIANGIANERHDINDTSGALLWPAGEYYQPMLGVGP